MAFDALLTHIGPAVARHPLALALGTLVLAEATFLALVRRQALALGSRLRKFQTTLSALAALLHASLRDAPSDFFSRRRDFFSLRVKFAHFIK